MSYNRIMSLYVDKYSPDKGAEVYPSLAAAFDRAAELRAEGVLQPLSIRLRNDEYNLSEPVVVCNTVSDVTLMPDFNGRVHITGGVKFDGFVLDKFNGADCFSAPAGSLLPFTDLFVDGRHASFTRYPESGFLSITDCENHKTELFQGSQWVRVRDEDIAALEEVISDGCIVSFCHYWIDEHSPVKNFDAKSGRLTLEYKSRFCVAPEAGDSARMDYCLENVAATFGKPNDWYLDRSANRVYYVPRDASQTPENISVYAPVASQLFTIAGAPDKPVHGIRFRDIDFTCTRGDYASGGGVHGESDSVPCASDPQAVAGAHGSITFEYARECSMENCSLKNFGVHGVNIKNGCSLIKIDRCDFFDGGAGGVRVNGGDAGSAMCERTRGVAVSDCRIESCGRRYMAACGVLIMNASECAVTHCEISDMYYTGVSCGWVWGYTPSVTQSCKITHNHIHNLGHGALSDMGGVYLLGLQPGTEVSNNVIHDVTSKSYGGWALYTDEGSSYITMENNICYNCSDNIYHQHYGSFNTIRNNIFAFAGGQLVRVSRVEEHMSIAFERNLMISKGEPVYGLSDDHYKNGTVGSDNNAYFTFDGSPVVFFRHNNGIENGSIDDVHGYGMDRGSVKGSIPFTDAESFDFTVDTENEAVKAIGFKPIDASDVGVRGH